MPETGPRRLVSSHALRARRRRAKRPLESCRRVGYVVDVLAWGQDAGLGLLPGSAASYKPTKSSNVSCANEMGEPNGERGFQ